MRFISERRGWLAAAALALPCSVLAQDRAAATSLATLTTFTLERRDGGYVLTDGQCVLKNENPAPGLPLEFTLPDAWCDGTNFVYDVRIGVTPRWRAKEAAEFYTLFALNQNILGYMTNSATVTFLKSGTRIMSRVIGEAFGDKAQVMEPMTVESNRSYSIRCQLSAAESALYVDEKLLGRAGVNRAFRWTKGRSFFIGGEARGTSVLDGEVTSFSIGVLQEKIACAFVGDDFGYFIGSQPHPFALSFPRGDGEAHEATVTVKNLDGQAVATLAPTERAKAHHAFTLPPLPFGHYTLVAGVSAPGAEKAVERSIALMPEAVRREPAERSPFGATEEWPLSREEFNPVMTEALFAKMAAVGMRWFRVWVSWQDVETEPGTYFFESLDTLEAQARKHGISLVLTIYGGKRPFQSISLENNPQRGFAGPFYALPKDMTLWLKYVSALATRYRGKIERYQIWNESDTRWFIYPFSAEAYVDILRQSAAAIRAANPQAVIHLAGFCAAYEPRWINQAKRAPDDNVIGLAEFYNLNPQPHFDVSDYHFYCINQPGQSFDGYVPIVNTLKAFLAGRGDGAKPLWDSETGLTSTPDPARVGKKGGLFNVPGLSERDHAIRIVTRQVQALSLGIAVTLNYQFRDKSGGFGIVRGDYSPKPVFPALVHLANRLYGKTYATQLFTSSAGVRCYVFAEPTSALAVLWTTSGTARFALRSEPGTELSLTDLMGNRTPVPTTLVVGEAPVYLESRGATPLDRLIELVAAEEGGAAAKELALAKTLTLSQGGAATWDIASPQQVKIGGETLDGQGRVATAGAWGGPADLSAKGRLALAGRTVSFSIDVRDDVLAPSEKELYDGDAVELFLDLRAPAERNGMHGVHQVIVGAGGKVSAARGTLPDDFKATVLAVAGGWRLVGSFALPPSAAGGFRFDVAVDDADDSGGRQVQMVWAGSQDNHSDPSGYGSVIIP